MDGFEWIVILVGGVAAVIAILAVVFLRKPLLAVSPATPEAVLRDLAYRLRATGVAVKDVPGALEMRVGSLGTVKVHAKATPRGTEVRYEVGASSAGWTVIILLLAFGYVGIVGLAVALWIHSTAREFARERVGTLLWYGPLGAPPPPTVRTLLLEGMSEAHRLASEAAEYEREASQNRIGLVVLGSLGLFALVFALGVTYLGPLVPNAFLSSALLAVVASVSTGVIGPLALHFRAAPRIRELEQDSEVFTAAYAAEMFGYPVPGAPRPGLELLLRAAERSAIWRDVRRRRKLWHDPIAGFVIFLLGYATVLFLGLAALVDILPLEMRAVLAGLGIACGLGTAVTVVRWRREVHREDEHDRRSWEARRAALESELWSILSG